MRKKIIWIWLTAAVICAGCHGPETSAPKETEGAPSETGGADEGGQEADSGINTAANTETNTQANPETVTETPIQMETPEIEEEQDSKVIEVQPICQYPELPTGCEITSLTMVLNYNGISADKCDIADHYLDKGEVGTVDFRSAFEGDPRDENSYGCYSPVIVNTANRYLQAMDSQLEAIDISGKELEDLFLYIDAGVPVIVWGTLDCAQGYYSVTWNVAGEDLTWYTPEHCMVLVGYDDTQVWVADPVHGDVRNYDRYLFKSRYESLYRQAVVIQ